MNHFALIKSFPLTSSRLFPLAFVLCVAMTCAFDAPLLGQSIGQTIGQTIEADAVQEQETEQQDQQAAPSEKITEAVLESLRAHREKLLPLQNRHNRERQEIWDEINNQNQLMSQIRSAKPERLESVRKEMDRLAQRLAILEEVEHVIMDEDPMAKENALKEAKKRLDELQEIRQEIDLPIRDEMADLQRRFTEQNAPFSQHFSPFFNENGTGEYSNYSRKYLNGNFLAGQVTAGYAHEKKEYVINVTLHPLTRKLSKNRGMIAGKYPVISKSKRNLVFLLGDFQMTMHMRGNDKNVELVKLLENVVELEALDKQLVEIKNRWQNPK